MVTARLVEYCLSHFHVSHNVPGPLLLFLSSALLLALFYRGGMGKEERALLITGMVF